MLTWDLARLLFSSLEELCELVVGKTTMVEMGYLQEDCLDLCDEQSSFYRKNRFPHGRIHRCWDGITLRASLKIE
jgi:hypothetical protein